MIQDLGKLQDVLKVKFKNQKLLENAFVHRSYLNEHPGFSLPSNERLEFLGDAILEFSISKYLYQKYTHAPEGQLTAIRSAIVKTDSLASEARKLNLGDYLLLSKGEEEGGGRKNPYLLANTFEALIGAIFLDQGMDKTEKFLKENLFYKIAEVVKGGEIKDPKSLFQELTQEKFSVTPTYRVLSEEGPAHAKIFRVGVFLRKEKIAEGKGRSKQEGSEEAAREALEVIEGRG